MRRRNRERISIHERILNLQMSYRQNSLWYSMGTLCSSATSVLMMIYVTRILGVEEAGVFAIAHSIAQLMLTIGWFSTRQFQVSDIHEEYEFSDYLSLKLITSVVSVIGGIIYSLMLHNYGYKLWITFLYCLFFVCDIFADLFSARFQQIGKLYISGMSYVLRYVGYNVVFFLSLLLSKSLSVTLIATMIYCAGELILFDYPMIKATSDMTVRFRFPKLKKLVINCFPLFISSFVTNFIVNIPKNAIELQLTSEMQTYYNIIVMPSSVINMFCMFAFVPLYTKIAVTWHDKGYYEFISLVKKLLMLALGLCAGIFVICWMIGIPALSLVYGVQLQPYKLPFMILIFAGCFNSINAIMAYLFTVIRKQNYLLIIYVIAMVITQLAVNVLISRYSLLGASMDYCLGMMVITLLLVSVFCCQMHKQRKKV